MTSSTSSPSSHPENAAPDGTPSGRGRIGWPVWAWGLWDWASAAFNAVITTFVFSVYLTSDSFGPDADTALGWSLAAAGVLVALLAPVTGQRSDRTGRRTFWLGVNTALVVVVSASMFLVTPSVDRLWLGLLLLAGGNVFFELASVNYNAMLSEVSTPSTVGRVSGLGWGMGYLGGIVLLLVVFVGLINPEVGWFGVSADDGLNVRVTMLFCAAWTLVFSLPVLLTVRDDKTQRTPRAPRAGGLGGRLTRVRESYAALFASVRELWRTDRNVVWFLGASAVFRDGLAGVFTFGAVLAAGSFGFTSSGVIVFGIAANVVAGLATIGFGVLDDRIGPKRVIMGSLVLMIVSGLAVFALHSGGQAVFWTFGLLLAVFVGPAQSASRTFLLRLTPAGREGQIFGLYATTGRAVSFLAPALFSVAIVLGTRLSGARTASDAQYFGILGIVLVLLIGLALLVPVRSPHRELARRS